MSKKYDAKKVLEKLQKLYNKSPSKLNKIGVGSKLRGLEDKDFLHMPSWWQEATNTKGIPFGKLVMIAGDSDSGKTSCAVEAMKAAQKQNIGVLYVETEGKTTEKDLVNWGVDPDQIFLVQSSIAEEAFELMFAAWDAHFDMYPDTKLLVIFDSIGNVVSMRDSDMDLTESKQKPGGKGQINRLAINKMVAKRDENDVAMLIVNYTYDNIGSPGKTNAGGKAVNFFSCLTYQTSRKQWLYRTLAGDKIRVGARVQWKLFKNHIDKSNPGPQVIEFDITADGFKYVGGKDEDTSTLANEDGS